MIAMMIYFIVSPLFQNHGLCQFIYVIYHETNDNVDENRRILPKLCKMFDLHVGGAILMKRDAHIHSPFCPHGTKDAFELYIEKAIKNGFTDISFTEHAPAT